MSRAFYGTARHINSLGVIFVDNNKDYKYNQSLPDKLEPEVRQMPRQKDSKTRLLLFQSAVCVGAVAALFGIKALGGEVFSAVREKAQKTVFHSLTAEEIKSALSSKISQTGGSNEEQQGDTVYVTPDLAQPISQTEQDGQSGEIGLSPLLDGQAKDESAVKAVNLSYQSSNSPAVNDIVWPATGELTSSFGFRVHPIYGTNLFHGGIDIGVETGTPVKAALPGVVKEGGYTSSAGNYLTLCHNDKVDTKYAHLSELLVSEGDRVYQGQTIALSGNSGVSTGPHLHFEIRIGGVRINPLWVLKVD